MSLRDRLEHTGKRFYCVCFTVRSGSTLLCADLAQWSIGAPTECVQLSRNPAEGESVTDYVLETVVAGVGPYFGFKITWEQAFILAERLRAEGEADATLDLRSVFPGLRSVRIVRNDKVAQAISTWRAVSSGAWHWPVGHDIDKGTPPYDFEAIRAHLVHIVAEEWLWGRHLARTAVPHMRLEYERYIEHRVKALRSLAGFLGVKPARAPLVDLLNVMRDEWTEEITTRVWDDLYGIPETVRLIHAAAPATEEPADAEHRHGIGPEPIARDGPA